MFRLIDMLASLWLNWHTKQLIKKSHVGAAKVEHAEVDQQNMEIIMSHPAVVMLADEASALLNEAHCDNYLEIDLQPRIDHATKPIRVTVQWMHGLSPAQKAAKLMKENDELRAQIEQLNTERVEQQARIQEALDGMVGESVEDTAKRLHDELKHGWEIYASQERALNEQIQENARLRAALEKP